MFLEQYFGVSLDFKNILYFICDLWYSDIDMYKWIYEIS